jgi:hypothetical protein
MAHIQRHTRNGKVSYRARYRDPASRERSRTFARRVAAEAGRRAGRVQAVRRPPPRKTSPLTGERAGLHLFATCRSVRHWTINQRPRFVSLADR